MIFSAHTFSPITAPLEICQSIVFTFVRETLFCEEIKNTTEDYQDAPWVPTFELETTASHRCYSFAKKKLLEISALLKTYYKYLPSTGFVLRSTQMSTEANFFLPFHKGTAVLLCRELGMHGQFFYYHYYSISGSSLRRPRTSLAARAPPWCAGASSSSAPSTRSCSRTRTGPTCTRPRSSPGPSCSPSPSGTRRSRRGSPGGPPSSSSRRSYRRGAVKFNFLMGKGVLQLNFIVFMTVATLFVFSTKSGKCQWKQQNQLPKFLPYI